MHVSRIARDTSRLTDQVPPTSRSTRLQTRSFAKSLSAYVANGASVIESQEEEKKIKEEEGSDDGTSDLSSAGSLSSVDIENLPRSLTTAKKRKRGAESAPITALSIATISSRATDRKTTVQSSVRGESTTRKARRQPAKKLVKEDGEVEIHPPPHWEEIYDAVTEMRKKILAPVDTMGCETLAEDHASPRVRSRSTPSPSQTDVLMP